MNSLDSKRSGKEMGYIYNLETTNSFQQGLFKL